jgi:hypothetical protein
MFTPWHHASTPKLIFKDSTTDWRPFMADDKTKTGGQDRSRINVNEEYELREYFKSTGK